MPTDRNSRDAYQEAAGKAITELLQTVEVFMMPCMAEDDIGEIRDELKAYKEQLDSLREDLKLLIRHSPQVQNEIVAVSNQRGNRSFDQVEIDRCRAFVERYGIR